MALPPLLLGAIGTFSTWDLDAILHEPARTAIVWERSQLQFEDNSLSPENRDRLRKFERSLYGDPLQESKVNALLVELMDRDRILELIECHDNGPAWTRPLRYRIADLPPRLFNAKSPAEFVQRWTSRPPQLREYLIADAMMIMAENKGDLRFLVTLLGVGRTESERLLLWHAFGGAIVATARTRQFDGAVAWKLMNSAAPNVDRKELAFGFGFRAGQFVTEFWNMGWRYPHEFLAHTPPEVHAAFARGFGAGYRLRFLEPPSGDLQSPAIRNLLTHLPVKLEPAFREGLAGASGASRFDAN